MLDAVHVSVADVAAMLTITILAILSGGSWIGAGGGDSGSGGEGKGGGVGEDGGGGDDHT